MRHIERSDLFELGTLRDFEIHPFLWYENGCISKSLSVYSRVGKVWNWSNLVLIKVVVFFLKFDKNFVWTKYFFHTYGFLSLEGPLLAGLCSHEPGPVSRACSKVKKPYVWKKYFVQTNFLSNLVKKSTTFINTKLLQFHTLPTQVPTQCVLLV